MKEGFLYAVTGHKYVELATASATSLKRVMPDAKIHIFSDIIPKSSVFDEKHILNHSWIRPKFEALRKSPFERSIYLDADTIVLCDIYDIFSLLENFDIAGAHVFARNAKFARKYHKKSFANSFPQINTGVLGVKKSELTQSFLAAVDREMENCNLKIDQPVFRELLFDSKLRIAILPPEYNFKRIRQVSSLTSSDPAPRIIHDSNLHRRLSENNGKYMDLYTYQWKLESLYVSHITEHLQKLIRADKYINPEGDEYEVRPLVNLIEPYRDKPSALRNTVQKFIRFIMNRK